MNFICKVYYGAMYVSVKVRAGAKRERVQQISDTKLEIDVVEPAQQNLANRRVLTLVAQHFKVPLGTVRILSGHRSPSKMFSVS